MARIRNGKVQVTTEVAESVDELMGERARLDGVTRTVLARKAISAYLGVDLDGNPVDTAEADPFGFRRLPSGMEPEIEQMTALELASLRGMGMAIIRAAEAAAAERQLTAEVEQWTRGERR